MKRNPVLSITGSREFKRVIRWRGKVFVIGWEHKVLAMFHGCRSGADVLNKMAEILRRQRDNADAMPMQRTP